MVEARDSKGHFIKGNVPWNRRLDTQSGIIFTCKFCGKQKPIEEMKVAMRFLRYRQNPSGRGITPPKGEYLI